MESKRLAKQYKDYLISLRREFHKYPEPSWQEFRTSKRIQEELTKIGIPFILTAKTGVIGIIKGKEAGKTIALRADMDALEVEQGNDLDYRSVNKGVMHACGHDGHMAMLLGAGKILYDLRDRIKGTIKLFFQPAEELVGGAKLMIKEGCMNGVDNIFGIHLWTGLPTGQISVEAGPRMAATDIFEIRVQGLGGHGSLPHQGVDALLAASSIVVNLQSIVSREVNPTDSAVVSIGTFNSGTRFNVIASEARLTGTTRCFNTRLRDSFPEIIGRIANGIAASYRASADLDYSFGTPALVNDPSSSSLAAAVVEDLFGPDSLSLMEKLTGGEDFAFYLEEAPGVFAFVGAGNQAKACDFPHHHAKFNIDEDALEIGTALYVQYALDFLNSK